MKIYKQYSKKPIRSFKDLIGLCIVFNFISIFLLTLSACCNDDNALTTADTPYELTLPANFPPPEIPDDNTLTDTRIELGKKLFFDPILSRDTTVSCATCHLPSKAFTDGLPIATGIHGRVGFRNAPSLANVAWHPYFFREGGSPSLETQALGPIADEFEMDNTVAEAARRLRADPAYVELSQKAYEREPNAYVISRALAAFQRILVSGNSLYDQYEAGNENALSSQQIRGKNLFFNDLQCATCHVGFDFTNYNFENNGLYTDYTDEGRARLTGSTTDIGKFKTPSLRNVALTAPYMHDGSLPDLQAVVEHYNSGGTNHPNKNPKIEALNLSPQQQQDLISFLESLTDSTFINNPKFR